MNGLTLHTLAQLAADRMLNGIAEGLLIALFVWALLRLVGRQGSATRFAVWFAALLAVAALPVIGSPGSQASASSAVSAVSLPPRWALYLFAVWVLVAGFALVRLVFGMAGIAQLRRSCEEMEVSALDPLLQETVRVFRARRNAAVCSSHKVSVPTAIGFFRPAVVIPAWAWQELSAEELNSILLHELAHLERYDDWTNLTQKFLRAVLFFHPAVWWIEGKLALEREMACDDVVLAHTSSARAYAECLVSLTEKGLLHRGLHLAQAAISRVRQTTLRVAQILDKSCPRATRICKPAMALVGVVASGGMLISANAPRLVSFDGGTRTFQAASAPAGNEPMLVEAKFTRASAGFTQRNLPLPQPKASAGPMAVNAVFHANTPKPAVRTTALKQTQRIKQQRPRLLQRTGYTIPQPEQLQPHVTFIMMQTRQLYPNGDALWTVTVFRFTSFEPAVLPDIDARKI